MKHPLWKPGMFGWLAAATMILGAKSYADNPIVQTCFTADPAPLVHDGTVYLYTGHDEDDATGFKMFDWKCFTSTDMVNWTDRGAVISTETFSWAVKNSAWASQCVYRNGKFYFDVKNHVLWTWSASEAMPETLNVLLQRSSCFRDLKKGVAHESILKTITCDMALPVPSGVGAEVPVSGIGGGYA